MKGKIDDTLLRILVRETDGLPPGFPGRRALTLAHELQKVAIAGFAALLLTLNPLPSHHTQGQAASSSEFLKPYAGVRPVVGTRPLLVILVQARDRPAAVAPTIVRQRFFGVGPGESVSTYFNEISYGRFGVTEAMVTPWLTAQDNLATPNIDESLASFVYQGGYPAEVAKAQWLIQAVDRQTNFDFARFDNNPRDGRITPEELLIMWVYPADPTDPQGGTGGRSRPADPWLIPVSGLSQGVEIRTLSRVGENANWRTMAHELLHQVHKLGDLYVDKPGGYPGVGPYSIMCASSSPMHLDPWARMKLGWLVPEVITQDGWIDLNDIERWPQAFILHDPARGPKDYFILENRWPGNSHERSSLGQGGLVVWRIEERHDDPNTDWARQTIDRIWPTGEPPPSQRIPENCPTQASAVFRGDDSAASYALTPGSYPGRLVWRDGSGSRIGLWFVSEPGPRMRVYVDMPPQQVGLRPEPMDYSVGSSRALGGVVMRAESVLAAGRSETTLIDVGFAADGRVYAWYRDGTVSAGHTPADLGNYRPPAPFVLPAGRTPYDIVAIAVAPDDHVYAWYRDGTVSAGSSRNLVDYRPPAAYTLPPGKAPTDIIGAGIAKDSRVYMWYRDGTVSSGTSTDLDVYRPAEGFGLPPGRHPSRIRAVAIDPRHHVYVWYESISERDIDVEGPVLTGAYLDPPAVQPGGSARVIVRALDPTGRPIAASVTLSAQAGVFPASSARQITGQASGAGYYAADWRAPQVAPGGLSETYIDGVVANAQRHVGRFRLRVPLLLQPIP
jgi:M6 family metalloprotease-like protein